MGRPRYPGLCHRHRRHSSREGRRLARCEMGSRAQRQPAIRLSVRARRHPADEATRRLDRHDIVEPCLQSEPRFRRLCRVQGRPSFADKSRSLRKTDRPFAPMPSRRAPSIPRSWRAAAGRTHGSRTTSTDTFRQFRCSRLATPEDVVGPILFLAGPGARYITGQTLHVNGGRITP